MSEDDATVKIRGLCAVLSVGPHTHSINVPDDPSEPATCGDCGGPLEAGERGFHEECLAAHLDYIERWPD